MKFKFIHVPTLPGLAWCAQIKKGVEHVALFHGSGVETRPDAFVEGAWDDDFDKFNFLESLVMSGTGGKTDDKHVRFTGSTDRICPLFSVRTSKFLYISNSLVFALSASGESPDPIYPYYGYDLVRIWRQGLHCLNGMLPLASKGKVGLHFSAVLRVDRDATLTLKSHDPGVSPTDYDHYCAHLSERVRKVFDNAKTPERKETYRALAAISRGYDSTATAILAQQAGCQDSFTFKDSRQPDPSLDSGLANARHLGLNCREIDRWRFTERGDEVTPEFSMFGTFCYTPLAGLEDDLRGRMVVSGYFGDTIWDPVKSLACAQLSQSWALDVSAGSLVEFRLRVGFLYLAPSFIMAQHNMAIHRITVSKSMQPWSIPGNYNRPIARRIIEEAGLPRGQFAVAKRGSGHAHFNKRSPRIGYLASEDYWDFLRLKHARVGSVRYYAWRARVQADYTLWHTLGVNRLRPVPSTFMQRRFPFLLNRPPVKMTWPSLFTLQWTHARLTARYRLKAKGSVLIIDN